METARKGTNGTALGAFGSAAVSPLEVLAASADKNRGFLPFLAVSTDKKCGFMKNQVKR